MIARAALASLALALVLILGVHGCASTRQGELEFQELGSRDKVPRRWYRVADAMADGLVRRLPRVAPGRVTPVEFEDQTPIIDVDQALLEERIRAAVRQAGYEVEDDAVATLDEVTGDVALVGSITETRNPAVSGEVVIELTAALLQRGPDAWSSRAAVHRRFRVMVALAPVQTRRRGAP